MDKLKIRIHKLSLYIGILNNFKLIFWYLYEMYCVLWTFEHKQKLLKLLKSIQHEIQYDFGFNWHIFPRKT